MTSKITVRFSVIGGMSKLAVAENPNEALEIIERARTHGLEIMEKDRHTGRDRFLTYIPPTAINKIEMHAFDPNIPGQIESVAEGLQGVQITLR